jgi:hypothetical protein
MKKLYTQPTVDLSAVEVEMGIAMSTQTIDGINDIYLMEEDVEW